MSWRRVVSYCSLGVAIGCASGQVDHGVVAGRGSGATAAAGTCEAATSMGPGELYLGDGVTDYFYYPIVDDLRENPAIAAYYRPVIDDRRDSPCLAGFSMLVVQNEASCKDARRRPPPSAPQRSKTQRDGSRGRCSDGGPTSPIRWEPNPQPSGAVSR